MVLSRYELFSSDFWSSPDYRLRTTDYGQTESDAYEPIVQSAQVGSKRLHWAIIFMFHEYF